MAKRHGVSRIEPVAESTFDASQSSSASDVEGLSADDDTFSFEDLTEAYSKLLGGHHESAVSNGNLQLNVTDKHDSTDDDEPLESSLNSKKQIGSVEKLGEVIDEDDGIPVTAKSILESLLFIGHPRNDPMTITQLKKSMRGIDEPEIRRLTDELNSDYERGGHAMEIVWKDDGLVMQIRIAVNSVRNIADRKIRETQLSQAAVDCLSLVAYNPGSTREAIEELWGRPATNVLGLLVRKDLLSIERVGSGKSKKTHYYTTDRFLNLVGLASLDDLPRVDAEI